MPTQRLDAHRHGMKDDWWEELIDSVADELRYRGVVGPATAIVESNGPTTLTIAGIADGQPLTRAGSTIVGLERTEQFTVFDAIRIDENGDGSAPVEWEVLHSTVYGYRLSMLWHFASGLSGRWVIETSRDGGLNWLSSDEATVDAILDTNVGVLRAVFSPSIVSYTIHYVDGRLYYNPVAEAVADILLVWPCPPGVNRLRLTPLTGSDGDSSCIASVKFQ